MAPLRGPGHAAFSPKRLVWVVEAAHVVTGKAPAVPNEDQKVYSQDVRPLSAAVPAELLRGVGAAPYRSVIIDSVARVRRERES